MTSSKRKRSVDGAYWVCGCATNLGEHICEADYTSCIYCGAHKSDCTEIVVPSGMGGVFEVQILAKLPQGYQVQVINNLNGFDALPPFFVPSHEIERRTRKGAGA